MYRSKSEASAAIAHDVRYPHVRGQSTLTRTQGFVTLTHGIRRHAREFIAMHAGIIVMHAGRRTAVQYGIMAVQQNVNIV